MIARLYRRLVMAFLPRRMIPRPAGRGKWFPLRQSVTWRDGRPLAADGARPIIFYNRGGTCWQPHVKGLTIMVNSIYNGWRMEDVWLDK
jgi:hypothetical protein